MTRKQRRKPGPRPATGRRRGESARTGLRRRWSDGKPGAFLVGVLLAAAVFRVAYLLQFEAGSIFAQAPVLDASVYDLWARSIAGGTLAPLEPFYFAPGYAYALAGLYALVSSSMTTVFLAQFVLGLLNIVMVHWLAARAFSRRAANWAAVLVALYASLPFLETKLLSATLGLSLQLVTLIALLVAEERPHWWRWVAAGAAAGLASLVRPETLLLSPLVLVWIWREEARRANGARAVPGRAGEAARTDGAAAVRRRLAVAGAALAAGWALAILPVTVHNFRTGGGTTLISSQAGITFYQGNNPRARGLYVSSPEQGLSGDPARQAAEEREIAERRIGRTLTQSEVSSYWFGRALEYVRADPGGYTRLLGMKLLRYLGSYEYSTEYTLYVEREAVWLLWLLFVPFGLLVALAAPTVAKGVFLRRRSDAAGMQLNGAGWLLAALLVANLGTCLIFYVSTRYRLAAVPVLAVFAGATLAAVERWWRVGDRRRAVVTVAVTAGIFLAVHFPVDAGARIQDGAVHYNAGYLWVTRGQHERAVDEFRRAVELDPSRFEAWFNLGSSLAELGRYPEAAEAYGAAASRQPQVFEAQAQLGFMLVATADWSSARAALLRAEALEPDVFEVQLALGKVEARLGDRQAALHHLEHALSLRPGSQDALVARERLQGFRAF